MLQPAEAASDTVAWGILSATGLAWCDTAVPADTLTSTFSTLTASRMPAGSEGSCFLKLHVCSAAVQTHGCCSLPQHACPSRVFFAVRPCDACRHVGWLGSCQAQLWRLWQFMVLCTLMPFHSSNRLLLVYRYGTEHDSDDRRAVSPHMQSWLHTASLKQHLCLLPRRCVGSVSYATG